MVHRRSAAPGGGRRNDCKTRQPQEVATIEAANIGEQRRKLAPRPKELLASGLIGPHL
jgi:hypothetical protein